jgi:hypothetical protein
MKQCFTAAQKRQDVRRAFLRFSHFVTETRQKKQNQMRLWREQMEQAAGTNMYAHETGNGNDLCLNNRISI